MNHSPRNNVGGLFHLEMDVCVFILSGVKIDS